MNEKDEELNRQLEAINDSFKLLGQRIAESATAKPIKGEPFIDFKTTKEINDSLTTIQKNTDELKEVVSESLGAVGVQLKDMMSELIPALVNAADRYAYKGIEVKKYCKLRGMSLKELCFCADVKEGTMRTYMNGSRDIPASVLIHITKLDFSFGFF